MVGFPAFKLCKEIGKIQLKQWDKLCRRIKTSGENCEGKKREPNVYQREVVFLNTRSGHWRHILVPPVFISFKNGFFLCSFSSTYFLSPCVLKLNAWFHLYNSLILTISTHCYSIGQINTLAHTKKRRKLETTLSVCWGLNFSIQSSVEGCNVKLIPQPGLKLHCKHSIRRNNKSPILIIWEARISSYDRTFWELFWYQFNPQLRLNRKLNTSPQRDTCICIIMWALSKIKN